MIQEKENSLTSKWRPLIAFSYMVICLFDFMIGPVIFNTLQYLEEGTNISMWQSITLQGGGLYHLSMGAIVGVSAFGRTKEKLASLSKE
jgi:hypothetical protein